LPRETAPLLSEQKQWEGLSAERQERAKNRPMTSRNEVSGLTKADVENAWPQVILSQAQVNSLCFTQSLLDVPSYQRRQHIKNAHFAEGMMELARGHAPCGLL
jgi:hypothetical protein